MAPPCIGMKGCSALNRSMAPDTWHRSRMISAVLGQHAGEIALRPLEHGQHFYVGNPRGSELVTLPGWEKVQQHSK
eukprot:12934709-Prorocentrum_lima.AAC.1